MDKENKKVLFVTNRNKTDKNNENESVLNSTARSYCSDMLHKDADISSIHGFSNELVDVFTPASNFKSFSNEEVVVNSGDLTTKQAELDVLYLQYLMSLNMQEMTKKSFKDEEDYAMKEMFEIHRAEEILKKDLCELDYEEELVDNLIDVLTFMNTFNDWIKNNISNLKSFELNYQKLSELCSKAKNFLSITNIQMPDKFEFETTLAVELKNTSEIIDKIIVQMEKKNLPISPDPQFDENINFKILEDLIEQYQKLKHSILKFNGLNVTE